MAGAGRPAGRPRLLPPAVLLALVASRASATVDCLVEPDHADCCQMELGEPCLMRDVFRDNDPCPIACQRKYQTLGWTCYSLHHRNFQWRSMARNCDPHNIVRFRAPQTPAPAPSYGASHSKVGIAGNAARPGTGAACLAAAAATASILVAVYPA
uniref:Folate receptor-like domain-containing protein n=1 Tax=Alexandrium monilatum TaxID=311494 RepID=A0A7S4SSH9_9DINO